MLEKIYIGLPALNEGSQIEGVIRRLQAEGFENVVVTDDGSTDDTYRKAKQAGAIVLRHPINCGAGAAVQTIIKFARSEGWEYLQLMDADGQHFAEDVVRLVEKMKAEDLDLVIGSRFKNRKNEIPRIRRFFNWLGNLLTNTFCEKNYSDTQSGFRLLGRKAIERLDLHSSGFAFCSEMIFQAEKEKLKIGEVSIHVVYTDYSMSKGQGFLNGLKTAWQFIEQL